MSHLDRTHGLVPQLGSSGTVRRRLPLPSRKVIGASTLTAALLGSRSRL
jgi:hypothetical protein